MPLDSANTMTCLLIDFFPHPNDPYGATSLDVFVNLTILNIQPLSPDICDSIIRAEFRLTIFRAAVTKEVQFGSERIVAMVSARSLTTVKKFTFKFDRDSSYHLVDFRFFIEALTNNIASLELLDLNMGLDLSWCPLFAQLGKLREFYYKVDMEKYDDSGVDDGTVADVQPNSSIRIRYYNPYGMRIPALKVDKAFIKAFWHFVHLPCILIEIMPGRLFLGG